ncbi:MAG: hypothetical protein ACRDZW_10820 [Acidimicrobiales bacterium]
MARRLTSLAVVVASMAALLLPGAIPALGQAFDPAARAGQWLVSADGAVFAQGTAAFRGSAAGRRLNRPIVGMAATPAGIGYWLVASDGGVFAFGDARFSGSLGALRLNRPIVGMAATPTGAGYWLVASDGGVFAFGDARFTGSLGALRLNRPIVGMSATRSGAGYWLVASDGGVFAFGDARFSGSLADRALPSPIVGMAESNSRTDGYWLAGADGSVFAFGGAGRLGPAAGRSLGRPVVAIVAGGGGYGLVGPDGAVFSFGETGLLDSGTGPRLARPLVGAAQPPDVPGDPLLPGTYVERPDSSGGVEVKGGVIGLGASEIGDCFCTQRLFLDVGVRPQPGPAFSLDAFLVNTTGIPLFFPTGLVVRFLVNRDGQPWRTVEVGAPSITTLPPRGEARATTQVQPDGDGFYTVSAEVTIVIR